MDEEINLEFQKVWKAIEALKGERPISLHSVELKDENNKIFRLCKELGIEKEDLDSKIKINGGNVSLIVPIDGKNEAEKQLRTTLVLMSIRDLLFEEDFMKSADIAVVLKRLGVKSIANLATNLNKSTDLLRPDGKPKSKNFGFRITIPGVMEGKKIIRGLVNGDRSEK